MLLRFALVLIVLPSITLTLGGFYKKLRALKVPDKLSFHVKGYARRGAFDELWDQARADILSRDMNRGLGISPRVSAAIMRASEEDKFQRYRANFVPAYNRVIFLPRHPVVTAVNFFALLSDAERAQYLAINVTIAEKRALLEEHAIEDLMQYDLEKTRENVEEEKTHHFHTLFSEETVNFTQIGHEIRSTGAQQASGIFSAVRALETVYHLSTLFKGSQRRHFSRQHLLNCLDSEVTCAWFPSQVFQYLHTANFLPLESDSPYTGTKQECQTQQQLSNGIESTVKIAATSVSFPKERGMLDLFKASGPVSVCIHVNDHIYYYKHGLSNECVAGLDCNHFVTLLAYNQDYFTFENSWGSSWGMDGRMNMLRGNCVSEPSSTRYLVTSVTLTVEQEQEKGVSEEKHQGYYRVMMRDGLVSDKDYFFEHTLRVGDVLVLNAQPLLRYRYHRTERAKHAYFSVFVEGSTTDTPYHFIIDLNHHAVAQTYRFGHEHAQFPKLIERLHYIDINPRQTQIRIEFTRTYISTTINGKQLQRFYHQADIKTIKSFEVHGPKGWFTSLKHLREKKSG